MKLRAFMLVALAVSCAITGYSKYLDDMERAFGSELAAQQMH